MISPTELRIGNYITHARIDLEGEMIDKILKVDGNLIKEIELHHYLAYNGIPLTPEIFDKCGAINYNKDGKNDRCDFCFWTGSGDDIGFRKTLNGDYILVCDLMIKSFKYLHEIQNLYFAFKGKELEINL